MFLEILNFLENLSFIDYVFFFIVLFLLILIVCLLYFIKINEDNINNNINLDNPDDLKALASIMKKDAEVPKNPIELTSYEQEQEEHAIINYDELLSNTGELKLNYLNEEKYGDVLVKQVDLNNIVSSSNAVSGIEVKENIKLLSYEKEEEFLKALKELQSNLL